MGAVCTAVTAGVSSYFNAGNVAILIKDTSSAVDYLSMSGQWNIFASDCINHIGLIHAQVKIWPHSILH